MAGWSMPAGPGPGSTMIFARATRLSFVDLGRCFHATLGEPKMAEKWSAGSTGEAIDWLRNQAIRRYPRSDFARQYGGFV